MDRYYREKLEELCLTSVKHIVTRKVLYEQLQHLSLSELHDLAARLRLVPPPPPSLSTTTTPMNNEDDITNSKSLFEKPEEEYSQSFLLEIFACEYCTPYSQLDTINALSLLPDEQALWSEDLVPASGSQVTALPKLNLQFLSFHDYLLRNFDLYRREAYFQIRNDLAESITRMRARMDMSGHTSFTGQARMAVPLQSFTLMEVRRAKVGEAVPAEVRGELKFSVHGLRGECRKEWESLREHDVLFLVHIQARNRDVNEYSYGQAIRRIIIIIIILMMIMNE